MGFAGKGYPMLAPPDQACRCSEGFRFRV